MNIGSVTTGSVSTAVWLNATRSLTADPATDAGAATFVWTHATRSLTLPGGAVQGSQLQAPSVVSGISMSTVATTNIMTFTGAGVFLRCSLTVTTATTGASTSDQINIVADGNTFTIPLHVAAITLSAQAIGAADRLTGALTNLNDLWMIHLAVQFTTSLTVSYQVTSTALTGGVLTGTAVWAHA